MTDASLILELSVENGASSSPASATAAPASEPATTTPLALLDAVESVPRETSVAVSLTPKELLGVELKKRKFAHTTDAQRRCMLEWLEVAGNFQLLASPAGSASANVVLKNARGKKLKKTDGFRALTHHVNTHTASNWTMEITKSRYESFMTTYRKVKAQAVLPDFVVTENDRSRGINDVAQKRNALCVYYDRIDALFHPHSASEEAVAEESGAMAAVEGLQADAAVVATDEDSDDHRRKRAKHEEPVNKPSPSPEPVVDPAEPPAATVAATAEVVSDAIVLKQLAMERERLDLLQQQLAIQKRQLDVREQELKQQEEQRKRDLQIEVAAKLIEAGKSAAEIKEILEVLAGGPQPSESGDI